MISAIIIGFIAGILARFLMPGKDPMGFIMTTLLGIGGAVLASFLGRQMGLYQPNEPASLVASVVGAVIILALYRMMARRRQVVH